MTAQRLMPGLRAVLDCFRAATPDTLLSNEDLAQATGYSRDTIKHYRAELRELGLIDTRRAPKSAPTTIARAANDPRFRPAQRLCLGPNCLGKKPFQSEHVFNRLCDTCRQTVAGRL